MAIRCILNLAICIYVLLGGKKLCRKSSIAGDQKCGNKSRENLDQQNTQNLSWQLKIAHCSSIVGDVKLQTLSPSHQLTRHARIISSCSRMNSGDTMMPNIKSLACSCSASFWQSSTSQTSFKLSTVITQRRRSTAKRFSFS